MKVSFLRENSGPKALSSVIIKVQNGAICRATRLHFKLFTPNKEYAKIPLERMFPEIRIPTEFCLSNDGQLYAITNSKNIYSVHTKQIKPLIKDPYPSLRVFYSQGNNQTDIRTIDVDEKWLIGDYKLIYQRLCQRCQYDQNLCKQILSTLIGLRYAKAIITYRKDNLSPIKDYSSFLSAIICDSPQLIQKQDILNKVIQYGVATQEEYDAATMLLNLTRQQILQQQQLQQQPLYSNPAIQPFIPYNHPINRPNILIKNNQLNNNQINYTNNNQLNNMNYNNNNFIKQNNNMVNNMNQVNNNMINQNNNKNIINQYNKNKQIYLEAYNPNNNINYNNFNNNQNYNNNFIKQNNNMVNNMNYNNFNNNQFNNNIINQNYNRNIINQYNNNQPIRPVIQTQSSIINYNNFNNNNYRQNYGNNNNYNQNYNNIQHFKLNIPISNQAVAVEWIYDTNSKKLVSLSLDGTTHDCQRINNGGDYLVNYNGVYYKIWYNNGCIKICKYGNNTPLATINASTGGITVNNQNPQFNNNYNFNNNNQNYNNQLNNNNQINNFNNNYNYGNNLNNPNIQPPTHAAAVEQGKPGIYDEDTRSLMETLKKVKTAKELEEKGFSVESENDQYYTISKNGKLLFQGEIIENRLQHGILGIKFKKNNFDNEYSTTEWYRGKFKNNLFHDENGEYTFEIRYNDTHERYKGKFVDGKQHGRGTFYDANGTSNIYEYDNGNIVQKISLRDMKDTDVIVFDAANSFQDAYTDRYANNFHIVSNAIYNDKKTEIFKSTKKEKIKMPTAKETPNEQQQKMMEFIQKHILVNFIGQQDYRSLCDEWQLYNIIGSSDRMREMKKEFFGNTNKSISDLIGNDAELRKKWLCYVVDKIGMNMFNDQYAMINFNHFVTKIKNNGNTKLKVVFSNHGSKDLHLFNDGSHFSENVADKVIGAINSLQRDTYVVNQSCYGGERFDKNIFIPSYFDTANSHLLNATLHKVASKRFIDKIKNIKSKTDLLTKFKQLMDFSERIHFVSKYQYIGADAKKIDYQTNDDLEKFKFTLFNSKLTKNQIFQYNNGKKVNIAANKSQNNDNQATTTVTDVLFLKEFCGSNFFSDDEQKLYDKMFDTKNTQEIFDFDKEFREFYSFLNKKLEEGADKYTAAEAEQEFVSQRLKDKCTELGVDYEQFQELEKEKIEIKERLEEEFYNNIEEGISNFLDKINLLEPLVNVQQEVEQKCIELIDNEKKPDNAEIKQTISYITKRLEEIKTPINNNFSKIIDTLKKEDYLSFIKTNFGSLYDFCTNNKDVLYENIFEKGKILSAENLSKFLEKTKNNICKQIDDEKKRITEGLHGVANSETLKQKLSSLKQKGFDKTIVYSKNLSNKMVHYCAPKKDSNGCVSNTQRHSMYYVFDKKGKIIPLIKDVEGFKKSLKDYEEQLETNRKKYSDMLFFDMRKTMMDDFYETKFDKLRKYIKEAKANKNILLHYRQPKELQNYKQTVNADEKTIINNNNAGYNQGSIVQQKQYISASSNHKNEKPIFTINSNRKNIDNNLD